MSTLGFEVEWFDTVASSVQILFLKYFLDDDTIELIHSSKNSTFLKRIYYPSVSLNELFIGNSVTVFQRLLVITKFANSATQQYMLDREVHLLCTVDRNMQKALGTLSDCAFKEHLKWGAVATAASDMDECGMICQGGDFIIEIVARSNKQADDFVDTVRNVKGITATTTDPETIKYINKCAGVIDVVKDCTLCIIKPHAVTANKQSAVINEIISSGQFNVHAIMSKHLHSDMADEFFRVYRNLVPAYASFLEQMCSGPCIAMCITSKNGNPNVVEEFREFTGPNNCELAGMLRPKSLRAIAGNPGLKTNILQNGIHCTDLPEDGFMENSYFFNTLCSIRAK